MRLRKKVDLDEPLEESLEFKKTTDTGYVKIQPINDVFDTAVPIGFNKDYAKIMIPEVGLEQVEENSYSGEFTIKKGFRRTFFEKRGAGYSSVAGDYYIPEVVFDVELQINSFGNQVIKKRQNGFKTTYVNGKINALDYIPEEYLEKLSEDDKLYFSNVEIASLREDLLEYLNTVPRNMTPYNIALFELNQKYDLFAQITEPVYIDVPTNQYEDADIRLIIGDETFSIKKYALMCKDENENELFGFVVKISFKDEILEKVKEDGYK
jgi:hypothetical protein